MKILPRLLIFFAVAAALCYTWRSSPQHGFDLGGSSPAFQPLVSQADVEAGASLPAVTAAESAAEAKRASVDAHTASGAAGASFPSYAARAFASAEEEGKAVRTRTWSLLPPLESSAHMESGGATNPVSAVHSEADSAAITTSKSARAQSSSASQKPLEVTRSIVTPNAPPPPTSSVIYSGLQNIPIPTNFTGTYINIDNAATGGSSLAGWDVNPFFGGVGVGNSPSFQPARTGSGNLDQILRLNFGALVDGSLTYSTGNGGSQTHVGPGANQFQPGQEAYLGFKFTTDSSSGPYFGWMRVIFTANNPGGVIEDWGYESGVTGVTPTSIEAGNILRAAPVSGVSVVTLSGNNDASLGSTISDLGGGVVTALTKNGANTWTLVGNHPYTGNTTINAGTLRLANPNGVSISGNSPVAVNNGGTLLMGANNQINQAVFPPISLGTTGGAGTPARFDAGGFSQGTGGNPLVTNSGNVGLGALTLLSSSVIDLTNTSVLHFANSNGTWTGTLSIWHWSGTPVTGGGAEQILFGGDATGLSLTQLGQVSFYSDNGMNLLSNFATILGDGEIVPGVVPVPEPATWAAGLLSIAALAYARRSRRSC